MTIDQQVMADSWNRVKSAVRARWPQFGDSELEQCREEPEFLFGFIQEKTGKGREEVEAYLERAVSPTRSTTLDRTTDTVIQQTGRAAETTRHAGLRAADTMQPGYRRAKQLVQSHAGASVAIGFGLGMVSGALIGLLIRNK